MSSSAKDAATLIDDCVAFIDSKKTDLQKRVILVTGGSRGVGLETCFSLKQTFPSFAVYGTIRDASEASILKLSKKQEAERAQFVASNDSSRASVCTISEAIDAGVKFVQLDVCSDESVQQCIDNIVKSEGQLDVLINNAGMTLPAGSVLTTNVSEYARLFEVNVFGLIRMVQAAVPVFLKQERKGAIINMSSCISMAGFPFMSAYTGSKAAVDRVSEALRLELKPLGVRVLVISPGAVKTSFDDDVNKFADQNKNFEEYATFVGNLKGYVEHAGLRARQVSDKMVEMVDLIVGERQNELKDNDYRFYCTPENKEFHAMFCKDPNYSNIFGFVQGALLAKRH